MKPSPPASGPVNSKPMPASQRPWEAPATVAVVALLVCNELLPVVFGTGMRALWDWSSLYVTMRSMIIPGLAIVVLLSALAKLPWSRGGAVWTRSAVILTCAGVVFVSWVYQLPRLGR